MTETNGNTPFIHTNKKAGDIIRSEDWNNAMNEVVRLETAKVNCQGTDTIQGPLTIEKALTLNDRVGIGGAPSTGANAAKLQVTGNAAIAGNLSFAGDVESNNLKLQFGSGHGIGFSSNALVYAANGTHSWRNANGDHEHMKLTTNASGGLTVWGTGLSSFSGDLKVSRKVGIGGAPGSEQLKVTGNAAIAGDLSITGGSSNNLTVTGTSTLTNNVGIGGAPSTGAEKLKVTGNTAITGNLKIDGAIVPSTGDTENTGIMFPKNTWGGSGDAAWIRYYRRGNSGEASTLAIGIENDSDDHIALMPNAGNVGIGTNNPTAKLDIRGGSLQMEGNQKIVFQDSDPSNNIKLQLGSGYGLGINTGTLFYTADGNHSWRDKYNIEFMKLTTIANGGLTVLGAGKSSFSGDLEVVNKVGIGVAPGTEKLKVEGDTRLNGRVDIINEPESITSNESTILRDHILDIAAINSTDTVQDKDNINLANSSFTILLWAKRNVITAGWIISQGERRQNNALHIGFRDENRFTLAFYGNDLDMATNGLMSRTDWHYWACVYDLPNKKQTLYLDAGQHFVQRDAEPYQGSGDMRIGGRIWENSRFEGDIADLKIFKRVLYKPEIKALMQENIDLNPSLKKTIPTLSVQGSINLSGGIIPDYDSKWFKVNKNNNYTLYHGLGTCMLQTQILFRDPNNRVWDARTTSRHVEAVNMYCGCYLLMKDENSFDFATAVQYVFGGDNTKTYGTERAEQSFTEGSYRIFAWKIGV